MKRKCSCKKYLKTTKTKAVILKVYKGFSVSRIFKISFISASHIIAGNKIPPKIELSILKSLRIDFPKKNSFYIRFDEWNKKQWYYTCEISKKYITIVDMVIKN